MCWLGYSTILVNFRGGLGFGEDSLRSLTGNIGTHDISDSIVALDAAVATGAARADARTHDMT